MEKPTKTYIFFFGPIGSGKGTQSDLLGSRLKLPVISPGELFRQEIEAKTKIGFLISKIVASGQLVDNNITEKILTPRLEKKDARNGYILDGFPRNQEQLRYILDKLGEIKNKIIIAIHIDVSDQKVKERISGRRVCDCGATYHLKYNSPKKQGVCDICGTKLYQRDDDKSAAINARLKIFHNEVIPIIGYFKNNHLLLKINGEGNIEEIAQEIYNKVNEEIENQ